MLEVFLQVNERSGCLNQALEKIVVGRVLFKPHLLQDVMRFVVLLIVPALKIGAVERVFDHLAAGWIGIVSNQLPHKSRNPLAFVHEGF